MDRMERLGSLDLFFSQKIIFSHKITDFFMTQRSFQHHVNHNSPHMYLDKNTELGTSSWQSHIINDSDAKKPL